MVGCCWWYLLRDDVKMYGRCDPSELHLQKLYVKSLIIPIARPPSNNAVHDTARPRPRALTSCVVHERVLAGVPEGQVGPFSQQ